ncbi:unnamed protein product [Caretta caretta]
MGDLHDAAETVNVLSLQGDGSASHALPMPPLLQHVMAGHWWCPIRSFSRGLLGEVLPGTWTPYITQKSSFGHFAISISPITFTITSMERTVWDWDSFPRPLVIHGVSLWTYRERGGEGHQERKGERKMLGRRAKESVKYPRGGDEENRETHKWLVSWEEHKKRERGGVDNIDGVANNKETKQMKGDGLLLFNRRPRDMVQGRENNRRDNNRETRDKGRKMNRMGRN